MAHPLIQVNSRNWIEILDVMKDTVAFLAIKNDRDTAKNVVEQYRNEISQNQETIFSLTASSIIEYINFYNVKPREGIYDEFKSIYFIGIVVSNHLIRVGLPDLNKLHLKATLRMLDFRLHEPFRVCRIQLTERISSIIDNNAIEQHVGKYGWYLIYKCLYNAANDKSKTL